MLPPPLLLLLLLLLGGSVPGRRWREGKTGREGRFSRDFTDFIANSRFQGEPEKEVLDPLSLATTGMDTQQQVGAPHTKRKT